MSNEKESLNCVAEVTRRIASLPPSDRVFAAAIVFNIVSQDAMRSAGTQQDVEAMRAKLLTTCDRLKDLIAGWSPLTAAEIAETQVLLRGQHDA
jgi:hypothetical protein